MFWNIKNTGLQRVDDGEGVLKKSNVVFVSYK